MISKHATVLFLCGNVVTSLLLIYAKMSHYSAEELILNMVLNTLNVAAVENSFRHVVM